jgi:Cd2+/Zn2+-exporting ATPase
VRRDGREIEVSVAEVRLGETVIIRPAARIPVDGVVRSGVSAVDQAPITGESIPAQKRPGDPVFAGTVNAEGVLEVETSRISGDRTLDRIIKLVEEAQTRKAPTEVFTERFHRVFVPTVLLAALIVIVVPPLAGILSLADSFYRAMSLLVGASPCALALGTPSAVLAGIAHAARNGVLIKGGAYLELLGSLRAFAFDKTGTLTMAKPAVTCLEPMEGVPADELLRIAAAVERRSQHPLAKAVLERAGTERVSIPEARNVQSVTARGVRAEVEGRGVEAGSLRLWEGSGTDIPPTLRLRVQSHQAQGQSVIIVRHGDR